jgi:hypothetical protein
VRPVVRLLYLALLLCASSAATAQPFTGRWEQRGQNESGLWLVTEQIKNTVKFEIALSRGAPSYNSGWIQGEVELKGNLGHFNKITESGVCEISFRFEAKQVELKQEGDYRGCGFGYGVHADGVLKRTSNKKTRFCADDPRGRGCDKPSP